MQKKRKKDEDSDSDSTSEDSSKETNKKKLKSVLTKNNCTPSSTSKKKNLDCTINSIY